MTLREVSSLAIWMVVLVSRTAPTLAQSNSEDATRSSATHPVEVTTFVSDDSTLRWRFGGAIGLAWTSQLNVETEINASTGINQLEGEELGVSASLIYSLRCPGRLRPYIAGGAGLEQYGGPRECLDGCEHPADAIRRLSRAVALNVGGGLKITVAKNLSVRADARWLNGLGRDAHAHWRLYSGVAVGIGRPR